MYKDLNKAIKYLTSINLNNNLIYEEEFVVPPITLYQLIYKFEETNYHDMFDSLDANFFIDREPFYLSYNIKY